MKTRGWGVAVLMSWLALGSAGCTSDPGDEGPQVAPAPPPPTSVPEESPPTVIPPPQEPASSTPPADREPLDPFEDFPSTPLPACVPESVPSVEATPCLRRDLRDSGLPWQTESFDAEGRVLESVLYSESGAAGTWTRHEYVGANEVRRTQGAGSVTRIVYTWEFDAAGREIRAVVRDASTQPAYERVTETHRDAEGRVQRVDLLQDGKLMSYTESSYDEAGLLQSTQGFNAWGDPTSRWLYTHHPEGPLASANLIPAEFMQDYLTYEYDVAGHLVFSQRSTYRGGSASTTTYDDAGRRTGSQDTWSSGLSAGKRTARVLFDAAGWPAAEQTVERRTDYATFPEVHTVQRKLRLFHSACGSGALVREELDTELDGVIDGVRTLERDDQGRLVREHFSGTLRPPYYETREYLYACEPAPG